MSDVVALRAALMRLGFSAKAAGFITDEQGLDTLNDLKVLTNGEIEIFCKVVRRPGGTVPNPNAGDPGQPATLLNPGEKFPLRSELNLKLACYYILFKDRTRRVVGSPDINLVNVHALWNHRYWEKYHKDMDAPELSLRDWSRNTESIEEWFRGCLGFPRPLDPVPQS